MPLSLKNMLRVKMGWAHASGPRHEVVLSSRVRLARNLEGVPFQAKASDRHRAEVLKAAFDAARGSKALLDAALIRLDEIEPVERVFLVERHLVSTALASEHRHRGVAVGSRDLLSCMVNEEDHLRLQGIDSGLCLSELLGKVSVLDDQLSAKLPMAFDTELGYLTACPTNTGTGMRASCLVHLPVLGLSNAIDKLLEGLSKIGITARGLYGEGTQVLGDFYQISNAVTLGLSEFDIIQRITKVVERIIDSETAAREKLAGGKDKGRLREAVERSVDILSKTEEISFANTMGGLSAVRMGLALGWKLPVDFNTVNELFVLTQPGHVQMLAGEEVPKEKRDQLRAALLRRKFRGD